MLSVVRYSEDSNEQIRSGPTLPPNMFSLTHQRRLPDARPVKIRLGNINLRRKARTLRSTHDMEKHLSENAVLLCRELLSYAHRDQISATDLRIVQALRHQTWARKTNIDFLSAVTELALRGYIVLECDWLDVPPNRRFKLPPLNRRGVLFGMPGELPSRRRS